MRVINLTHGKGNGINKACLMTASNMLIGKGEKGDQNSCVCPVLRAFILKTNDAMPEILLRELYTDLIWEILGTKTDLATEILRAKAFADWARQFAASYADDAADDADADADASYAAAEKIWRKCPDIIRKVAAIGDKRPKEPKCVITPEELEQKLASVRH